MKRYIGLSLMIMGFTLMFISAFEPAWSYLFSVRIVYDPSPPLISNLNPAGGKNFPTPLPAGEVFEVSMAVDDPESGVKDFYCTIYVTDVSGDILVLNITSDMWTLGQDVYRYKWKVPSGVNVKYKFVYVAVNNAGVRATEIRYGVTGTPNGVWLINGMEVKSGDTIYVSKPDLNVTFKATALGDLIEEVYITVKRDLKVEKVVLSEKTENIWQATYTLSWGKGNYLIDGYVKWRLGEKLHLLSITIPYGVTPKISLRETVFIIGLILTVVGLTIYRRAG